MAMNSLLDKLRDRLQAFRSARGGNVMIIFSLAIIPIVGAVGAAVDYSRANSAKADMQAALDSTALKLAKDGSTLSSTEMQASATSYFNAIFNRPEAQNVAVTATTAGSTLTVSGSATIKTTMMGIVGFSQLNISASSTATWGMKKLEIALVLDNSGSMNGSNKMSALQSASHQLLSTLQKAAANLGDIRVAIIPFANNAKIDAMNAYGTTNLTIGFAWGWHALTPNEPLTEATAPSSGIDKYIILLTDGTNTDNRWWTDSSKVDARTKAICANIKAAGIKIYTVKVMDGDATVLQGCASESNMYSQVTSSSQISTAFTTIAKSLITSSLRITK